MMHIYMNGYEVDVIEHRKWRHARAARQLWEAQVICKS